MTDPEPPNPWSEPDPAAPGPGPSSAPGFTGPGQASPPPVAPFIPGGAGRGAGRHREGLTPPLARTAPANPTGPPMRAAPASAASMPAALLAPSGSDPDAAPSRSFRQGAISPLWWWLASVVVGVLAFLIPIWFVTALPEPDDYTELADRANAATWFMLGLIVVSWILAVLWLYQIGSNAGTYGLGVVLGVLLFPFWLIAFALLGPWGVVAAFAVFTLGPLRLFVGGMWVGGRLPPLYSLIGWVPYLVGTVLWAIALAVSGDTSDTSSDQYGLQLGVVAISWALVGLANLFIVGGLIAVTIIQHVGIYQDRKNIKNYRRRGTGGLPV